jgi:predicted PurR-regulated permease PerM
MTTTILVPTAVAPGASDPSPAVSLRTSSVATSIIALLAVAYTLALARPFLLPIAFAWLAKSALAPVIRLGGRLRVAAPLSAALIVVALAGGGATAAYQLSGPATAWAERLPEDLQTIRGRLHDNRDGSPSPIESVAKASEAVAELADATPEGEKPLQVAVVSSRRGANLLGGVWDFGANLMITLVLLYFMLATGDAFLTKVVEVIPRLSDAKAAVATARAIEERIALYLSTVLAINAVLGLLVGLACWFFGLPNPILWGVLASVFNFVPYVGALCGISLVGVVGLTTFPDLLHGMAPALTYAGLTAIEGLIVTPVIVGRMLTLSPVFLFVWLLFMSWLWGIPGALLAVPLLAAGKIICDHIPRLRVVGRLLGA